MARPTSKYAQDAAARASGFKPPLFDRLREDVPPASPIRRGDDREQLQNSIRNEIRLLLNTRRSNPTLLDPAEATTLDYGIPSFTPRSAADPLELLRVAALITNAIMIFEPRLLAPLTTLLPDPDRANHAIAEITGSIRVGTSLERFSFPLAIDEQTIVSEVLPPLV